MTTLRDSTFRGGSFGCRRLDVAAGCALPTMCEHGRYLGNVNHLRSMVGSAHPAVATTTAIQPLLTGDGGRPPGVAEAR